jgi:hypothetical protein
MQQANSRIVLAAAAALGLCTGDFLEIGDEALHFVVAGLLIGGAQDR